MRIILTILAALGIGSMAHAADLMEIYRAALSNDAAYAAARGAHQAAQEKLPQGQSLLLPSANLSANSNYNNADFNAAGAGSVSRSYNTNAYTLALTQPLFRKQNLVQFEQSKLQLALAEAQFGNARMDVMIRVAQAYFDILLAQDNVDLAAAQKEAIAEQLAQAKRNFEVGSATITDTNDAQARYDLIVSQEIVAQNDLEIKRRALQLIVGTLPDRLKSLRSSNLPLVLPQPNDMDKWVEQAETESYPVQASAHAYELAVKDIELNRAGHLPTLDAVASYNDTAGFNPILGGNLDIKTAAVGVQLSVPLYQGGFVASRVREAEANKYRALQDLESARRAAALQTRQAFLGVVSGVAQVKALEQALVSSQSSLDSSKLGQEVGVRTSVDVLNARQQLFSARRDLYQARYNYILSNLRLRRAVSSLTEEDFQRVNELLVAP